MNVHSALAASLWGRLAAPEVWGRLVAVSLTLLVATLVYLVLRRALDRLFHSRDSYRFLARRLLGWIYVPILGLIVLEELGVALGHVWTVVSAMMALVAVGFVAAWSLLSNVSAAFMIISTRLFQIGDDLELLEPTASQGLRGKVVDLQLLFTTIEQQAATGEGRILTRIPNNVFFQKGVRIRYGGAELPPASATAAGAST